MPKNRGSSPGEEGGGEGGDILTGKLSGGCEAHSLKPLPNFRPKSAIFPDQKFDTLFQI